MNWRIPQPHHHHYIVRVLLQAYMPMITSRDDWHSLYVACAIHLFQLWAGLA